MLRRWAVENGNSCWLRLPKRGLGEWGRWRYCKGVGAGFVKAVGYHGGGRVRQRSHSDSEESAGSRDCSMVVERLRVRSDSHCRGNARRWGWDNKAGYCHCH